MNEVVMVMVVKLVAVEGAHFKCIFLFGPHSIISFPRQATQAPWKQNVL